MVGFTHPTAAPAFALPSPHPAAACAAMVGFTHPTRRLLRLDLPFPQPPWSAPAPPPRHPPPSRPIP